METNKPLQKLTKLPLTKEERSSWEDKVSRKLNTLKGEDLDSYWDEIEKQCPGQDMRSQRWEHNHQHITRVISNFIKEYNQVPTKSQIAGLSGISRQTIHKHLVEFRNSQFYQLEDLKLKILNHKVMAKVYREAEMGNIKAARLFFEMNGALGTRNNARNYFIQINNLKVDENVIKSLPNETIIQIEQIISKSLQHRNSNL